MKRLIKILAIIAITFSQNSCSDDFLDIELKNDLGVESYYKTPQHAYDAITSCYDPIKGRGFFAQNYQFLMYAFSDRIINENSAFNEFAYAADNTLTGGSDLNFTVWGYCYRGVFRTNLALKYLPDIDIPGENPEGYPLKERYLGEARFLRAMYYFYLRVHFYQPILLEEPMEDLFYQYTNADPEELWIFIENDLKFAIEHLPDKSEYADADLGRATKGAAIAMLGKTYLYQQKWDSARVEFQKVIDSNEYGLSMPMGNDSVDYVYAYLSNFSFRDLPALNGTYKAEHNIESIFEINNTDKTDNIANEWNPGLQSDGNLMTAWFGALGFRNVVPKASFLNEYEETPEGHPCKTDPRLTASIYRPGDEFESWNPDHRYYKVPFDPQEHTNTGITQGYGFKKWLYPAHYSPSYGAFLDPTNWRIIRYADVLLMYAEASYHSGVGNGLDALNQVRVRAGLEPIAALTPEAIIHERDIELFGECVRFPDMVRWTMLPDPWVQPSDIHKNFRQGKHEYFPIPEKDIKRLNGSLKQNPGW
jgi:hypothetical protein